MPDDETRNQRTVTVGILPDDNDDILIVQRAADEETYPGQWQTPGGKVDIGEAPADALAREYREETGLEVAVERPLTVRHYSTTDRHNILVTYEVDLASGSYDDIELNEEHQDYAWVGPDALTAYDLINDVEDDLHAYWEQSP